MAATLPTCPDHLYYMLLAIPLWGSLPLIGPWGFLSPYLVYIPSSCWNVHICVLELCDPAISTNHIQVPCGHTRCHPQRAFASAFLSKIPAATGRGGISYTFFSSLSVGARGLLSTGEGTICDFPLSFLLSRFDSCWVSGWQEGLGWSLGVRTESVWLHAWKSTFFPRADKCNRESNKP